MGKKFVLIVRLKFGVGALLRTPNGLARPRFSEIRIACIVRRHIISAPNHILMRQTRFVRTPRIIKQIPQKITAALQVERFLERRVQE
jgi:hypothetical protein